MLLDERLGRPNSIEQSLVHSLLYTLIPELVSIEQDIAIMANLQNIQLITRQMSKVYIRTQLLGRPYSKVSTLDVNEREKFNNTYFETMRAPHRSLYKSNAVKIPLFRDDFMKTKLWSEKNVGNAALPLEGFNFVDVGSGGGLTSEALARLGANVTGIDVSPNLIALSEQESKKDPKIADKVKFICTTAEEHVIKYQNHYDALVCSFVIEHVQNRQFFFDSCAKLVKKDGSLFFNSLNRHFLAWWRVIFLSQYVFGALGRGAITRKNYVRPEDLRKWMESNGFLFKNSCGLHMSARTRDWSIIKDMKGFYYMHAVKIDELK